MAIEEGAWAVCVCISYTGDGGQLGCSFLWSGRGGWDGCVRYEEVLQKVKEKRNTLHTIETRNANWVGHNWRRNCLLQHVIEGKVEEKIEVTGKGGR
jgi:hypothetical protein